MQILITVDSTEPTLQSDHQKYFGGLFWVIEKNYQLRWNSVFLQQEKGWPELESNQRHKDFQSSALPTELSSHYEKGQILKDLIVLRNHFQD